MPQFAYSALAPSGAVIRGELDGADAAAVIERLHAQGLMPIQAEVLRPKWHFTLELGVGARRILPGGELALFSQQLARLLKAGLPLERALEILTSLLEHKRMRDVARRTLAAVRDGASLGEAMAAQQGQFPQAYVSMIRAGEEGAALQPVLGRLAEFLVRSEAIRQKIISAMIYPAVLVVVAIISITVVLTVVLPEFEPLFQDAGSKIPTSTRTILAVSELLRAYWWAIPISLGVLAIAWQRLRRVPSVARACDAAVLRVPVLRDLVTKFEIGRFARTLGVLLANGVAEPRALALCAVIVGNRDIYAAIERVAEQIKEGERLSTPLTAGKCFPTLSVQLIRIGEETGRLEEMLQEIADIYDQEVQHLLDRMLALLVPAITIVMGMVIATIITSIMTAMMSINDLVG